MHSKVNHKQNEKITYRLEENTCNFQNIQAAHTIQYQQQQQKETKNNPIKNWAEDLNRHFSKEAIWMVKKYMKRHSTSLFTGEIQIKTAMMYHLTLVRIAIIKKSMNSKCWRGCGEKRSHLYCW